MPPKFGRNFVFKLRGYPIKLPVTSVSNIVCPLNTVMNTTITIDSPHAVENTENNYVSYDIWITSTEPEPGKFLGLVLYLFANPNYVNLT